MRVLLSLSSAILIVLYLKSTFKLAAAILSLQATWWIGASDFYISEERDHFDATFANYSVEQQSVLPEYPDLVPAVLHQISLGRHPERPGWVDARKACVDLHPDWELHFWTDENASKFVEEKFPHLKAMWDGYQYPIQRVDALRYMILYEYGGTTGFPKEQVRFNETSKQELFLT
jgi:mannosyltransferase OCH1-like enzyme